MRNINVLGFKTCFSLLLSIGSNIELKPGIRKKLFHLIEILGFKYSIILNYNPNNLEIKYANWAYRLRYKKIDTEGLMKEIKDTIPNNSEFFDKFKIKTISDNKTAKYILHGLSKEMCEDKLISIDENATVEHVLPQKPIKWIEYLENNNELIIDDEKVDVITFANSLIYRIGNLTLLYLDDNVVASDSLFDIKKEKVFNKSQHEINKKIRKVEIWNKNAIDSRQEELAKLAISCWDQNGV